ncbi:hypothetical protein RRG08_065739 [Elysia crispata]|uniref:Uncharacterized protein n=1 Tax=Elysia crispata TaxID=231223 RepID=A0AAE0Z6S3_9GAST|nr:hypothetical protein RRG08_065739 [Elysia crispata]
MSSQYNHRAVQPRSSSGLSNKPFVARPFIDGDTCPRPTTQIDSSGLQATEAEREARDAEWRLLEPGNKVSCPSSTHSHADTNNKTSGLGLPFDMAIVYCGYSP